MEETRKTFINQPCPEEPLISELLLFGVYNCQNLTVQQIINNQIQVGVLQHYRNGEIIVEKSQNQLDEMWVYPDGIKIYDNRLKIINDLEPQDSFGPDHKISVYSTEIIQGHVTERPDDFIFSFVHTNYGLSRTYFTALCWHEKKYCALNKQRLNIIQSKNIYAQRLPKCTLWQLQNDPLMIDFNKQLIYIPKVIIVASRYPIFIFQRQILKFYYRNVLVQTSDLLISQQKYDYFKDLIHLVGYPQAERYFDNQHSKLISSKKIKHKQIKKDNLKQFYTSFFFLPKFQKKINQIQIVDCWNSSIKFTPMLFNRNICFYKPNINILSIISKIGLQNLIKLWKCVILQRQILIFSMNNIGVIELCETILYLIEPIRWENIYIPFLPFHLVNSVDAIHGYIIGMSRIHMDYIIEHFSMNQRVIYDFDQNVIIQNGGKNQVQLPTQIYQMILSRLDQLGIRKRQKVLFSSLFKSKSVPTFHSQQQKIFRIKQVFFDAMLYLLNNYRLFAKLDDSDLLQFDREGYCQIFTDTVWSTFASELIKTMVFVRLCEYHLYQEKKLKWNQYSIGGLFVYCQNILAQKYKNQKFWQIPRGEKGFQKLQIPYHEYFNFVLSRDLQKLKQSKKVYQIQHYLIKYLNYLDFQKGNANSIENDKNTQNIGFKKIAIYFLFPWVRQIEDQCRNQNKKINNRKSLRFSFQDLPNLQSLFGQLKPQGTALTQKNIDLLLKEHKKKQSKYLNYKMLSQSISQEKRISV